MCLGDYRQLAKLLKTPPMFADVLPLMVNPDEVELLIEMGESELSINDLAKQLSLPESKVESIVDNLFCKGFLNKKKGDETYYSMKTFRQIVSRYLSEHRKDSLGKYVEALANYRLEERVKHAKGDSYPGAKVLPIPNAVIEPISIILPYETAINILEEAKSFSIRDCECRVTYENCDKPLRTCLALNDFSEELIERRVAKEISLEESKKILQIANEHGLIHQVIYKDWLKGETMDLCSCCSCCCTVLRTYTNYGIKQHIAKSGLVAKVDSNLCTGCGICLERCIFKARKLENGKSLIIDENCMGCGLCTTTCPTEASKLILATY